MFRWMCDPVIAYNLGLSREPSLEETKRWVREAIQAENTQAFAILSRGRHVGNVVLDRIDRRLRTARLSIYVGDAGSRGRGVGRKAIQLALDLAFNEVQLEKVWLTAHARNVSAIRTYVDAGFRLEGIHRSEFLLAGERMDEFYLGILRGEYAHVRVKSKPR
jgi:RimJ/RimL family protein N-acetyltransferase